MQTNYSTLNQQGRKIGVIKNTESNLVFDDWQVDNNTTIPMGTKINLKYKGRSNKRHSDRLEKILMHYTVSNKNGADAIIVPPIFFLIGRIQIWYGSGSSRVLQIDNGEIRYNYLSKLASMDISQLDDYFEYSFPDSTLTPAINAGTGLYNYPSVPAGGTREYQIDILDGLDLWRGLNLDLGKKIDLRIDMQLVATTSTAGDHIDITPGGGTGTLSDLEITNLEVFNVSTRYNRASVPRSIRDFDTYYGKRYEFHRENNQSLDINASQRFILTNYFKSERRISKLYIWRETTPVSAQNFNSFDASPFSEVRLYANGTELSREKYKNRARMDEVVKNYNKNVDDNHHFEVSRLKTPNYWFLRNPNHSLFLDLSEINYDKLRNDNFLISQGKLVDSNKIEVELFRSVALGATDALVFMIEYSETWKANENNFVLQQNHIV
jgi:hypothetical protein